MSNLKQRVKQIQQQLAVSNTETIARFREARASMDDALAKLKSAMDEGFAKMERALSDQGEKNQTAMNQLLELMVDQDQQLADHEARLKKLEGAA